MTKMSQQGLVSTQLSRFPERKRETLGFVDKKGKKMLHYIFFANINSISINGLYSRFKAYIDG